MTRAGITMYLHLPSTAGIRSIFIVIHPSQIQQGEDPQFWNDAHTNKYERSMNQKIKDGHIS